MSSLCKGHIYLLPLKVQDPLTGAWDTLKPGSPNWSLCWGFLHFAGNIDIFLLHNQPQQHSPLKSHRDQVEIINVTVIDKQC